MCMLHVHPLFWVARASKICAFHHDFSVFDFEVLWTEIIWAAIVVENNLLFVQWNL